MEYIICFALLVAIIVLAIKKQPPIILFHLFVNRTEVRYIMFPDVLRRLRKKEGWSQAELAVRLGLAKSTISMYENGTREPSLEILEAIADIFNVDMNTLTDSKVSSELSEELQEYLEELKNRSEMRMMFKTLKGTKKEDVEKAVRIIEALRGKDE